MHQDHVRYLCCVQCRGELLVHSVQADSNGIKEGTLTCRQCSSVYPIVGHIPRFIPMQRNYVYPVQYSNFGYQWNKHNQTQYDRFSGIAESQERFFKETRWPHDLKGELVLEVGSGSGRFTEHALATGAMVVSFDYSLAVEANYKSNGHCENLLLVQADIYNLPFRDGSFTKIFCFGVIQHTPDPLRSFRCMVNMLADKGEIVIDCYRRSVWWKQILLTKYWVRPFTKRLPHDKLYRFCEQWVSFWWGVTGYAQRNTKRKILSHLLCIHDYRGIYPLSDKMHKQWAILDTFDMLSPQYDYPKTLAEIEQWFTGSGLKEVEVCYGYNGIEGRGHKR